MKLKLLAPFAVEGFVLQASRIMHAPDAYEQCWDDIADAVGDRCERVLSQRKDCRIEAVQFTHGARFSNRVGSRYREIDTHTLPRPMHMIELLTSWSEEQFRSHLAAARQACPQSCVTAQLERIEQLLIDAIQQQPPRALVRVYDHGVALFDMDLPVAAEQLNTGQGDTVDVKDALDALQQLGIALAEILIEQVNEQLLEPLLRWLRQQRELAGQYLRDFQTAAGARAERHLQQSCTMWVTRWLIMHRDDTVLDGPRGKAFRKAVVEHWLKDVAGQGRAVRECTDNPAAYSMQWLNYYFGEEACSESYPAHPASLLTPANGTQARGSDAPYEAMLIAQYYYAAFDRLQSKISRILTISVAGEGREHVSTVKADLDRAVRDATMLKVEFEENDKYYSRTVRNAVNSILKNWGLTRRLRPQIDQRIEECIQRLNELHSRAVERSSVYTDLILIAIGITGVFEVLLFLSMYGRTMSADADLAVYDRTSVFNIANWIGASSTDVILFAGSVFSIGLVLLYVFFRMSRSRV